MARWLLTIACFWMLLGSASAQASTPGDSLARWQELSEEERETLRERFRQWKRLPEAERTTLRERTRRFEERKQELRDYATEEERAEYERLPRRELDHRLREKVLESARRRGRFLRERVPDLARSLETADPRERRRILEGFQRRHRAEKSGPALRQLAKELGLSRNEMDRLQGLPMPERLQEVVRLQRRHLERTIQRGGGPAGVTPEELQPRRRLGDEQFLRWFEQRRSHRGMRPGPLRPGPGGAPRGPAGGPRGGPAGGGREGPGRGPGAGPGRGPRGGRAPDGPPSRSRPAEGVGRPSGIGVSS